MTTKQLVLDVLDRLPDDCTLSDVLYHLHVVESVQRGIADADAGRTRPHAEVAAALREKWLRAAAQ